MYYYKRNIGDYHKKAGRLSMLEHGAYTLLIDSCYDRERFPTEEEAIDWTWARTEEEVAAVKFVLRKFFTLIDGKYVQSRIKQEVERYKKQCETNSRIAKNREETKRSEHEPCLEDHEPCSVGNDSPPSDNESTTLEHESAPNQEPRTINQEPIINTSTGVDADGGGQTSYSQQFEQFWDAYPKKVEKKKTYEIWKRRKLNTLTDTLVNDVTTRMATDRKWIEGFIPNPTTYLNGNRWEDEIQAGQPQRPSRFDDRVEPQVRTMFREG